MALQLYGHPFSSYCQKVLIALYENAIPFTFRLLEPSEKRTLVEFAKLSPMRKMPVLVDDERVILPSFARAVDEARPSRAYFPPGAPDRD